MPEAIVLGFDLGSHSTGVAIGNRLTGTATPIGALRGFSKGHDWPKISQLIEAWQPALLLVGRPLNMFDEAQPMTARSEKFMRQLNGRYGLPVELVEERLTSREAHLLPGARHHDKAQIDSLAAVLIVESWLQQRATGA